MAINQIHPTVVIEGDVQLGHANVIGPYTVLRGPLRIGDDNLIGPHVCVGMPGQDTRTPRYDSSKCLVEIGSRNIIREFSSIEKPRYRDVTRIGSDVFVMAGAQISHDAIIEDKVVITSKVSIAGLARIMEGANIGTGAAIHQFTVIGPYSIVGLGCSIVKNVRPFLKCVPGKPARVNAYAVHKFGFDDLSEQIEQYVLQSRTPRDERLSTLVQRYDEFHRESQRAEY